MFLRLLLVSIISFLGSFAVQAELTTLKLSAQEVRQDQAEIEKAAQAAVNYFSKNPKQLKYYASRKDFEGLVKAVKTQSVELFLKGLKDSEFELKNNRGKREARTFEHPVNGLIEVGFGILQQSNRENVFNTYATLYESLPSKISSMVTAPRDLYKANIAQIAKAQSGLDAILAKFRDIILASRAAEPQEFFNPMKEERTSNETGHMFSNADVGDSSNQCRGRDYHAKGLINQVPLARNKKLTSVKDQSNRGTCVSFAIAAAAETEKIRKGDSASNFSEQSIYGWAKYMTGGKSKKDGLNTVKAIKKMKKKSFNIGYETLWQYNQSNDREDFNGTTYPDSCDNYSGACSERSMQLVWQNGNWAGHFADSGPYINSYSSILAWYLSREAEMNRLIALNRPAIVSITTDEIFRGSTGNSDGYLDWGATSSNKKKGGHAMMYVGYVSNDHLPDGVRDARGGGYVVFKNSYGTGSSDCGFFYADHDYVKDRLKSIVTINI